MLHSTRRCGTRGRFGIIALGAAALGGCATIDNDRLTVARAELPALAGSASPISAPLREATAPSIIGIDRSNWPPITIELPSDGTRHHPSLTRTGPRYDRSLPRNRGRSPTATTALDLGSPLGPLAWEGWSAPIRAGMDVVLAIPRLALAGGPGGAAHSPDAPYQREMGSPDPDAGAPALDAAVAPIKDGPPTPPRM